MHGLESLGYDDCFRDASAGYLRDGFSIARVVEVNKGNFRVADGAHEMVAELSGKFMFTAVESTDLPTIGDWVVMQTLDGNSLAVIHAVLPRKTVLKRKEPGRRVAFQLIAANIDYGMVMLSSDDVNRNRLERYLVMLNESGIEPIVVVSKIDLLNASAQADLEQRLAAINARHVLVSAVAEGGVDTVCQMLLPQKTYCLLGPSGVGKTSLLNRLLGAQCFRVQEVREKDGRGRHTTVRRQLACLASGALFIDTPGMRELGNFAIAAGMEQTFDDILSHGAHCRFRDCTHTHETGCAVVQALEQGSIDAKRYQNYLKLKKESEFYGMSYREKRKKDKAFGKMVKNYKKMRQDGD